MPAMFDFRPAADTPKPEAYRQLVDAAEALTAGEPDGVANMANMAALLWDFLPDLNWAGFYRVVEGELVLGPFMGRPACIRIPMGQGVCGTAAKDAATQLVEDVHAFPGHIACDAVTSSELVYRWCGTASHRGDLSSPEGPFRPRTQQDRGARRSSPSGFERMH